MVKSYNFLIKGSNSVAIDASILKTTKDDASRASIIDANYLSIGANTGDLTKNMNYLSIGSKTLTPKGSKTLTPKGSKTLTPKADMTPVNLTGVNMTGVNMTGVNMTGGTNDINKLLKEYEAGIAALYPEDIKKTGGSNSSIKLKRRTKKYRAKKRTFKRRTFKKRLNKTLKFTKR